MRSGRAIRILSVLFSGSRQQDAVRRFEDFTWDVVADDCDWLNVIAHLVNRKYAADDHVGFGVDEHWHDETGTVAQHEVRVEEESLKGLIKGRK